MQGSLALHRGVLYVGRHEKTAHVSTWDLDGMSRGASFSFRDPALGRASAMGIAVDDDRRVWLADTAASYVRCFTLFGTETARLGTGPEDDLPPDLLPDVAGVVRQPIDVAVEGDSDAARLVVASGGVRRHAVQVFTGAGRPMVSLRPEGDPQAVFRGVRGVALDGRFVYVAETGAGRVQVFRDHEFHFLFRASFRGGARFEPTAVAPLPDGRMVVAHGGPAGGLILFDAAGRVVRVLATCGREEGAVFEPNDVAVDPTGGDRTTRVAVIDRDGDRVQVFTLEGRCYGSFRGLAG
ncbi:MAG: hypothetical protein O7B99_13520 [Planctomycetota bacterium]|nr:hypothetical protein [Planctomycetota bacterium]